MPLVYRRLPFITISKTTKDNLIALAIAENTISVVHCGIDHNLYKPNFQKKNDTPLILYLGRFKKYKRLDLLIHALPPLFERRPDLKFYIVGKGEEEDRLKKLSQELHLDENIVFQGFVSEDEKAYFLQKAWLLVTPSMNEGWGLTVVEANACGTPAIAFDVPGLRDSIVHGKTGLLIKENDFTLFVERIEHLIQNDTLRREMEKNSLAWSESFNWDKTAEASLKTIYNAYPTLDHK
jgi:glycosyltransferase involved in cell wall biosynthesis